MRTAVGAGERWRGDVALRPGASDPELCLYVEAFPLAVPGSAESVGVAWIDIDKEHYGLHGTPEPSKVGHTSSHGCVRLTNWDAARLAALVAPGTPVIFK